MCAMKFTWINLLAECISSVLHNQCNSCSMNDGVSTRLPKTNLKNSISPFLIAHYCQRVIILLDRACLHNRIGKNWCKFSQPKCGSNVTAWRHSRLRVHCLIALGGECSVYYLSFIYGRSQWAELNVWKHSLHWKANMLPLFSIMTKK